MQVLYERCAGIDVHQKTVVVTILVTQPDGQTTKKTTRTFATMTAQLRELAAWLDHEHIEQVAIESTGVYWWPVYNLLEAGHTVTLVNPQHMKAVPGHKTDVKDSEWLADLLRHGLLKASFIPERPIRELRELTRYRKTLVRERAQEVNRIHKVLESANIKLAAVASDVVGASARRMLEALLSGETDIEAMAQLAHARMRRRIPELRAALLGDLRPQHRVLLRRLLDHIDFLDGSITQVQAEIDLRLIPYAAQMALLQSIPGVNAIAAATIIAEIGVDMARFPSARHLASWAGVCPGNKQSGGKRLQAGITEGDRWLRGVLGEVVWAITHTKDNYLVAQYQRLVRRRGKYKAIVAVMHSLLVAVYHILQDQQPYHDLGADYFDRLEAARIERHYVRRLEQLGYTVTLTPSSVA
jgi:transposase